MKRGLFPPAFARSILHLVSNLNPVMNHEHSTVVEQLANRCVREVPKPGQKRPNRVPELHPRMYDLTRFDTRDP